MKNKRPVILYFLMALVIFQGLSGLIGGVGLVIDPTGKSLQIPIEWLDNSFFDDYLTPGLILLIVLGFYPIVVFYGILKNLSWSWFATLFLGIALLIWIGVEIVIIGYQASPPLQLIYGLVGLLILVLVLSPPLKRFYKAE
jgi:hypothetical protein